MSKEQTSTEPMLWDEEFLRVLASVEKEFVATTSAAKAEMLLRYQTLMTVGGFAGPRTKEFLSLTWQDIVNKDEADTFQFKIGKLRKVHFDPYLIQLVNCNFKRIKPLNIHHLILHKQGDPYTPIKIQQFNQGLSRRLTKAGVYTLQPSSQTLRKTFGMHVYRDINNSSEEGLKIACKLLDLRSIDQTIQYLGLDSPRVKKKFYSL